MREAKQIAARPALARLVLRELKRELGRRLAVEPRADCSTHATAPATEALRVLREVHQVRADAADLRQRSVCSATRLLVTELCSHRERKDGRIVLGRTSRN